jgi:hypothetical protein
MKKIQDYKNSEKGICLIVGTAPSLDRVPLEFLRSYKRIGVNFSILHIPSTYHAIVDCARPEMTSVVRKLLTDSQIPCFISPHWWKDKDAFESFSNEIVIPKAPDRIHQNLDFVTKLYRDVDLLESQVTSRVTVVLELAIPLAFYLGFEQVVLAGVELKKTHLYAQKMIHSKGTGFDQKFVNHLLKGIQKSDKFSRIFTVDKNSELPFQKWSSTF